MQSLKNSLQTYQKLLKETEIQSAYRELISYITKLQGKFKTKHPDYEVSTNLYQGYLDLSFFTITTELLKPLQLKIAVVFLHREMRFEAWLSGRNRAVMSFYRKKLEGYNLGEYYLANDEKGMDSIIEGILVNNPDFDNLNELTAEIEFKVSKFINDIQDILIKNK